MNSVKFNDNLISVLLKQNILNKRQAETLNKKVADGADWEKTLIDLGVTDDDLAHARGEIFNLPFIDILNKTIDRNTLRLIPKDLAVSYKVVPFEVDEKNKNLKLGIVDPGDFKAIEAVEYIAREKGFRVDYFVISLTAFNSVIKNYETLEGEVEQVLDIVEDQYQKKLANQKKHQDKDKKNLEEIIKSAPVSKMVESILKYAVEGNASDIHIEPADEISKVRYRIDGILHTSLTLPKHIHNSIITRLKVMSNLKIDETRIPQDGRIRVTINDKKIDLRISFLPLYNSEKVVMRVLDVDSMKINLESLGFWGKVREILEDNIKKAGGMLLVTGPTGSGKSTTLYAILNILNTEEVNILTLEDPIEYYMEGINQSQVNNEVGYGFANGLRAALRQDPDIIMVGEVRDNETAELAIHATLTGHMVLSTLHTNNAIGAIPRLIDMGIEPFLISSTLNVVLAQRLARRICSHCREEVTDMPQEIIDEVKSILVSIDPERLPEDIKTNASKGELKFYRGKGCPRCGQTGYQGRVAVVELLAMNEKLKKSIEEDRTGDIEKIFIDQKLPNMQQDGVIKVLQGLTTMEEVMRVTKK